MHDWKGQIQNFKSRAKHETISSKSSPLLSQRNEYNIIASYCLYLLHAVGNWWVMFFCENSYSASRKTRCSSIVKNETVHEIPHTKKETWPSSVVPKRFVVLNYAGQFSVLYHSVPTIQVNTTARIAHDLPSRMKAQLFQFLSCLVHSLQHHHDSPPLHPSPAMLVHEEQPR